MIINDRDCGWRPAKSRVHVQQEMGEYVVEGSHKGTWARGGLTKLENAQFWIRAWQGFGTSGAADSGAALAYLRGQLRELAEEPYPVLILWDTSAQPGAPQNQPVSAAEDGWYYIEDIQFDRELYYGNSLKAQITASRVAKPGSMGYWWSGAALSSASYTGAATLLAALPPGAINVPSGSAMAGTAFNRAGAEGNVPCVAGATMDPIPFGVPATQANLFTGTVKVFDTVVAGGNAVPTGGTFTNANWVQVYGRSHDFVGDCVVTNGLVLMLFQVGVAAVCQFYVWNTSLAVPAWQLVSPLNYKDNTPTVAQLRGFQFDILSPFESWIRCQAATSNGHWAQLELQLKGGRYDVPIRFMPLDLTPTIGVALELGNLSNAIKIAYTPNQVTDVATVNSYPLAATSPYGFGAVISPTANSPIVGWALQSANSLQTQSGSTTEVGTGDNTGPAAGTFRRYAMFAAPYGSNGAGTEKLMAEGESGSLGTGWTSVTNASASNGSEAKAASGTTAGNVDTFGTAFQPAQVQYDIWYRMRSTANTGTTPEMQVGWWDATAAAFVALSSSIVEAHQLQTTYNSSPNPSNWFRTNRRTVVDLVLNGTTGATSATAVFTSADQGKLLTGNGIPTGTTIQTVTNATTIVMSAAATTSATVVCQIGAPITPPAGHNLQFRAAITATLDTDIFIDEACAVPIQSATLGAGNAPGDLWSQSMFDWLSEWSLG